MRALNALLPGRSLSSIVRLRTAFFIAKSAPVAKQNRKAGERWRGVGIKGGEREVKKRTIKNQSINQSII